ncbi:MAG: hypothetical protein K2U26_00415 [Cyclobacteriaceae bacterium]|nr:hypothetical protein [Cyclobacteriaceae bacterium]
MAVTKISYHTSIKYLVRENLLAKEICDRIPRTNMWRWKKEASDKYVCFDLNLTGTQDFDLVRSFAQNKKARRIYSAYVRLARFYRELTHSIPEFQRHVRKWKMQVVRIIDRVKESIGLARVLRFFNISVYTFRQWSMESYTQCFQSAIGACNRIYPAQLSKQELGKLKEKLLDSRHQYWPISSIAFQGLKDGTLPLSLNTWYKYANRLGLVRPRPSDRRKKKVVGIRAVAANEIWHADITRFVTADHVAHYIYLVVDNFSRKILSWQVADKVNASIRKQSVAQALKGLSGNNSQAVMLVTDGGPENSYIQLAGIKPQLHHTVALVDVMYSNSLIEAHNKVIKYNYLYRMQVADGVQLKNLITWIANDFNNRPHISLKGLTPNECYANINLDVEFLQLQKKIARVRRKESNQANRCSMCSN